MLQRCRTRLLAVAISLLVGLATVTAEPLKKPSGHLITTSGKTEINKGQVVIEVRLSETDDFSVSIKVKVSQPPLEQESSFATTSKLPRKDAPWFVYSSEDGLQIWVYDGREVSLRSFSLERSGEGGLPATSINSSFKNADADLLRNAPQAVRDRLPKELLK